MKEMTPVTEALKYLQIHSGWAWRKFAKDSVRVTEFDARTEFETTAERGGLKVYGLPGIQNSVFEVDRRFWRDGRISVSRLHEGASAYSCLGSQSWSHLAIASADLEGAWPKASVARRVSAKAYVWLKRTLRLPRITRSGKVSGMVVK